MDITLKTAAATSALLGYGPDLVGKAARSKRAADLTGKTASENEDTLFVRERTPSVRAGFGEGTISGPAAAIRTLNGGLESARRVVPTLEEMNAEVRARIAEQRKREDAQTEQQDNKAATRVEIPNATTQARDFINALARTAGTAQARLEGRDPESDTPQAVVRIGGQSFYMNTMNQGLQAIGTQRLDLFA